MNIIKLKNRQKRINSSFLLMVFLFISFNLFSQDIGSLSQSDLSGVRSEDVSDDQLISFIERGKGEGVSPTEAISMARARGMSASVANELAQRARRLETERGDNHEETLGRQMRDAEMERVESDTADYEEESSEDFIFGSNIFRRGTQAFETAMHVPTPVNYQLGAGDELIIDIWGAATNLHQLQVSPEGTVTIDNHGPVYVHGLTIEEATERIMDKLYQLYKGLRPGSDQDTYARVSLGRVRSIQVTVIGEVNLPGTHTLSSLSTVFNALYKAEGPNDIGTYRAIEVIRDNEKLAVLDIYDLLMHGDQTDNIRLQDQDVIRVGAFSNRVKAEGEVKRPGFYEVGKGETISDLIEYAGEFTERAYTRQLRLYRNTETERMIVSVKQEGYETFSLTNGDVLSVDVLLDRFENRVSIEGAVWRPGDYQLEEEGMTLSGLIEKADGVRPDVFSSRGVINRLSDTHDFITESFDIDQVLNNPEQYDIELQPEDQVIIKSIHDMRETFQVSIGGEVQERGNYQFRDGMTLEDLILKADGFRESASEARIEINRRIIGDPAPDFRSSALAETFIFSVSRTLSLREDAAEFKLQPFDQVFVRSRPDYSVQLSVEIEGEVMFPGDYALTDRRERISDLIRRAGGLTDESYIEGATMVREASQLEREDVEVDLDSDEFVDIQQGERTIGIQLATILDNPGGPEDLFLRPGDKLRIPQELQTVQVTGGVLRDAEIRHIEGRGLNYYISQSGGYSNNARKRRVYVVHANGDVETRRHFLLFSSNPDIKPGSQIIIPEKEPRTPMSSGERISVMSSIVSMAAVAVTAISRL
ncbi:SLBB domain-containing protein [Marinilabiliaceae bacterium ANBcel2]|nr:SLBB domain-containing protein [Marinilabiliaceae bacterium ANBcel2]